MRLVWKALLAMSGHLILLFGGIVLLFGLVKDFTLNPQVAESVLLANSLEIFFTAIGLALIFIGALTVLASRKLDVEKEESLADPKAYELDRFYYLKTGSR